MPPAQPQPDPQSTSHPRKIKSPAGQAGLGKIASRYATFQLIYYSRVPHASRFLRRGLSRSSTPAPALARNRNHIRSGPPTVKIKSPASQAGLGKIASRTLPFKHIYYSRPALSREARAEDDGLEP